MDDRAKAMASIRDAGDGDALLDVIRELRIEFIDLRFIDLPGRWHHVTLTAERVGPALFSTGVGFDGASVPGFTTVEHGDMVLMPDPSTAVLDDVSERPTLAMIASAAEADTRAPFPLDPRVVARRAESLLTESGIADTSLWSPEMEFCVFSGTTYQDAPDGAYFGVESHETGWFELHEGERDLGYRIQPNSGYHAVPPMDMLSDLRGEIVARMERSGIPVKYHHHENGAAGQVEIEMFPETLLLSADHLMLGKFLARNTACEWGMSATFMPKPLRDESGNGMHYHVKLFRGGEPIFSDPGGYAGLSEAALNFIGGILLHGRALSAVTAPSTNSYRRLLPGYEAPTNLFFSAANRSAAIRIPKYATAPNEKTFEYRPGDATANPYLAMAALLAAGMDGVERKIDPTTHGYGPYEKNVHGISAADRSSIVPLPATLEESLVCLETEGSFLAQSGIFPEEFVPAWVALKRDEAERVRRRPHPFEYNLYFDF